MGNQEKDQEDLKELGLGGEENLNPKGDSIEEGQGLVQEKTQETQGEELDTSEITESNEETELNWKKAASILKKANNSCGYSIEDYFKRMEIDKLRKRFNNKERSFGLYSEILTLGE